MNSDIAILPLKEPEQVWMEEVYQRNLAGQRFSARDVWSVLHDRLPKDFRPAAMDPRLITAGGERLQLFGIIALKKDYTILDQADQVIIWIREQLLTTATTDRIAVKAIAEATKLSNQIVSLTLSVIQEFGHFYRMCSFADNSVFIKDIEIGGDDNIYYRYIGFQGIRPLITQKSYEQFRGPVETFTFGEMKAMNEKLDTLIADIQKLKAGQEVIWTDIIAELNELKAMYSLGKKNWKQLFLGKLAEMTVGGIVSDTISKWVEEIFKSEVSTFLPYLSDHSAR